jgi:PAS domain S-box-containing protein
VPTAEESTAPSQDNRLRFSTIFDQAAVGLAQLALDGRWLQVNPRLCEIVGYRDMELFQRTLYESVHPDTLHAATDCIRQLIAGRTQEGSLTTRLVRKDGVTVWVHQTFSLVRDSDNVPDFLILVVEEISARHEADVDLRASEAYYRTLVDAAPQVMWLNYPDGGVLFFNRRWYEYTGQAETEAKGLGWLAAIHPEDRAHLAEHRKAAVAAHIGYQAEARFRQRDGTYCWHLAQVEPLRDAAGALTAWIGTATEMDARKRSEAALQFLNKASAALAASLDYETTLQAVAQLAVPTLADYCLVDLVLEDGQVSRVAAVHRDPAKESLIQQAKRFPPVPHTSLGKVLQSGEPDFQPVVSEAWLERAVYTLEHRAVVRRLDPQSVIVVPMVVRNETIGAISMVSTDKHHLYDQTDLNLAQNLASRAAQAVDNARLYREAQEAVREREAFLSIASHELRNPLTTLLANAQVLQRSASREEQFSERQRRMVRTVYEQSARLGEMFDVLLDLSQIEEGQLTIERTPLDLGTLVRQVVEDVQAASEAHTIVLDAPEARMTVLGDSLRLEQVLRNLLSNAGKYSPEGTTIKVAVTLQGDQVRVSVLDQGVGVSQEALPHLFSRFYRVPASNKANVKGLGIGLYVVKEIVTQHGGTMSVESTEGAGSTFSFCLPLQSSPSSTTVG